MNKTIKKALLVVAASLLISSCGTASNNPNNSGNSASSEAKVTKYNVVDRTGDGVTLSFSEDSAPKGTTITIAVTLAEGYILNGLYANGKACTKVNDTTYTFVMPDSAVAITASLSIEGDVVTSGDIAIKLEPQADGTYLGTFEANDDVNFILTAAKKEYGIAALDYDRSYGYITSKFESGNSGASKITLGGNAKYEICFDLTKEKPISVYRTGILKALESESEVSKYFCGWFAGRNVLDGGAYNVRNVNHVEYSSTRSAIDYTWDLYQDGSFATAKDKLTDDEYYVYKSIKDNVYTVVDTYVESQTDNDGDYDRTKLQDSVEYSAKYSIVDEVDNSHYQYTSFLANADMKTPSHELHSINSEIQYGYYIGYTVESELKACDRKFTGKKNEDGTYSTTIHSWKNYEDSTSSAVYTRYEYDITIDINADGTLKSVTYLENYYTKDTWSFDNDDTTNGGSALGKPKVKNKSSVRYGYGEAKAENIAFDTTPYFITSIDSVTVKSNKDKTKEDGHVKFKEVLDEERRDPYTPTVQKDNETGYTSVLSITHTPSTALDAWQYGIIGADDDTIIGRSTSRPREWIGYGVGTTNVTIGNHTTNSVTAKASVTIDEAPVPTAYFVWAYGNETEADVPNSSAISIKAGRIMKVYLWASPVDVVAQPIVTCSNSDVKLSVSEQTVTPDHYSIRGNVAYILTVDASSITTNENIEATITVTDKRDSSVSSEVKLTIRPGTASLLPASIANTTWTGHNYNTEVGEDDERYMDDGTFVPSKITFTDDDYKEIDGTMYKKGKITITGTASTDYDFYYWYGVGDSGSMVLKASAISVGETFMDMGVSVLEDYGLIGLYLTESSWGGAQDVSTNYLIGFPEAEEGSDYEGAEAVYQWYTMDA